MVIGDGVNKGYLDIDRIKAIVMDSLNSLSVDGRRVIILIPDATRTMPMPLFFDMFEEMLSDRVSVLDYLIALGTHRILDDHQLGRLVGRQVLNGRVGNSQIFNHDRNPENLINIGTITAQEISLITNGLLSQDVPVKVNKQIFNYDQIIICGPVFPHEVVGFSGGNKYLIPGIAGPEIINFTHWLGALITNYRVIGKKTTPVRIVIDRAAEFVDIPTASFCLVVHQEGIAGLYFGRAQEAWQAAAELSEKKHIIYMDRPFKRVLSIIPGMYEDLWTAAKGMYKVEPVIADGGEVVIYAPHIREISFTHGKLLSKIGYHCRDYYLAQWKRFNHYPGGVLAHSTHLKGLGTYDLDTGIEKPRIQVTLATGISAERCASINLGYLPPGQINLSEWQNREDDGIFVVPHAGETLYRLKVDQ